MTFGEKCSAFWHRRRDFFFGKFQFHAYLALLLVGFFAASSWAAVYGEFDIRELAFVQNLSRGKFLLTLILSVVFGYCYAFLRNSARPVFRLLAITATLYAILLACRVDSDIYLNLSLAVMLWILWRYLAHGDKLGVSSLSPSCPVAILILLLFTLSMMALVSILTVYRYRAFSTATFDFGIFAQAFEQMRKTGIPLTTVEREGALSHFAVHYSPVFYLLLPIYKLFPTPSTLLVMQTVAVFSGALVVFLICRRLRFSSLSALVAGTLYLLLPSMANGLFYDFHENKFLPLFVLLVLYFALCERPLPMLLCAALVLSVKEDAAVYTAAIALWLLFSRGEKRPKRSKIGGALLLVGSVAYFFFALAMIRHYGGEPMVSRFAEYIAKPNGGFLSMLETIFYDLGFLLKQMLTATYGTENPAGKLLFLCWVFVPMLFLPFRQKKPAVYFLFLPMLVINLMQVWPYQHDIGFQYTYGSVSLAFFMMLLPLVDIDKEKRRALLLSSLSIALVFTASLVLPKAGFALEYYNEHKTEYIKAEALIDSLRDELTDAKVVVGGYLMPHFFFVDDLDECPTQATAMSVASKEADYFIIDLRADVETTRMHKLMGDNFELYASGGIIEVYKRIETTQ